MIPIWNSLNVKLHFHLTTLSAKTTNQCMIKTSTSLKNNTNAFPFALLCVRYSILPTPLCSVQTYKSLHLPWQSQLLCSYLAHRLPTTAPILCHQILPRHHFQSCLQHMPPTPHITLRPDRIDASWQDCPDTGCSTVGYMIFHKEKHQHQKSNTMYYIPSRPAMNHGPWTKRMCKPSRK